MSNPLVVCILLTADRPEMTARAVRSFEAQTYPNKDLLVFDSGIDVVFCGDGPDVTYVLADRFRGQSIGALRNAANTLCQGADLITHWDSDDYSHPNRLAEQVALIESDPQLDAVGYTDMLFWDTTLHVTTDGNTLPNCGQAWLYSVTGSSHYLLGTSLLYRRAAWERKPFEDTSYGEDRRWLAGLRTAGHTSLFRWSGPSGSGHDDLQPRMIASIHGSNASSRIDPSAENWKRASEWDAHCRATMALPALVSE